MEILLLNALFSNTTVLTTIQAMIPIYPGVSSTSEHTSLKLCINQFQKEEVCDKMK
jgi:hypothetical protein